MEIQAVSKSVRISPRKVRLVAKVLQKNSAAEALLKLALIQKRGAKALEKTLKSAIANGVNNLKLNKESLFIKSIEVGEGTPLKRFHPSTRGRVHPYKKKSSHITIILEEKGEKAAFRK